MPGSALSWSLVAVLRSSLSADSDAATAVAGCAEAGVTLAACIRKNASNAAKIFTVKFCPLIFITYEFSLGVNAALADGVSHAVDGQHIGGDAIIHFVGLGITHHVAEG